LLNRSLFDEGCAKLEKEEANWEKTRGNRNSNSRQAIENMRVMQLQWMLYAPESKTGAVGRVKTPRNWNAEDLQAMVREAPIGNQEPALDDDFPPWGGELLHCMVANPDQISRAARSIPRLKSKRWYLTKYTRTFFPSEMRDLEFEPAVPALAEALAKPIGRTSASLLARLGTDGVTALIAQCRSSDSTARKNAASGLQSVKDSRAVEALLPLLNDNVPATPIICDRRRWK
jgi:hypothetical protein